MAKGKTSGWYTCRNGKCQLRVNGAIATVQLHGSYWKWEIVGTFFKNVHGFMRGANEAKQMVNELLRIR